MKRTRKHKLPRELETITRQIVDGFHPDKIIMFGSYAYGEPTPDSDVDLMVVMETEERATHKAGEISAAVDHPFPLDILVRTPKRIKERLALGDGFIKEIIDKGVVLYEAPDR